MIRARSLLEAARAGRAGEVAALGDRASGEWAEDAALGMARWWAGLPGPERPSVDECERRVHESADPVAAWILVELGAMGALLAHDGADLGRWTALLSELAAPDASGRLARRAWSAWERIAAANEQGVEADLGILAEDARAAGEPQLTLSVHVALALAHDVWSSQETASASARRAWRMARAEESPLHELFASLVLARIKRRSGMPHVANRILSTLASLAPAPFRPWIAYELELAGGSPLHVSHETTLGDLARHLRELAASCAGTGDADLEAVAARAVRASLRVPLFAPEVRDLTVMLGAAHDVTPSEPAARWIAGSGSETPGGLHAFALRGGEGRALAYVHARPSHAARRVLTAALPRHLAVGGVQVSSPERRPQERTMTALAVLLLWPETHADEAAFFREIYGFDYDAEIHRDVFDALVHRARQKLGDAGELRRADGRLSVTLHKPLLAWDPRCAPPLEDRLLALIGTEGRATVDDASQRLGYSRRAIQGALRQLVDDGLCRSSRDGRHVEYALEDSTFSGLTRSRFSPST